MIRYRRPASGLIFATAMLGFLSLGPARAARGAEEPGPQKAEVVVSATKMPEDPADIAAPVSMVTGEELRRQGVKTVAEAIQDLVGVDTGNGSDNGPRLANIGMWGLKEFDALLVTVDGVPAGGPFNPSLSMIPIEEVDRIEIVKGPQGTLYGVSAFAGMVQVFTRPASGSGGSISTGGGSFGDRRWRLDYTKDFGSDFLVRIAGGQVRGDGWQERTGYATDRLSIEADKRWANGASHRLVLSTYHDTSHFGSPLPVDAGLPIPGFQSDRNYAVDGARLDHRVYSLTSNLSVPLKTGLKLENTLGLARDEQISVRSYIDTTDGVTATATGLNLRPVESTVYDDLRLVADFSLAGAHKLVGGAALTWGRTTGDGHGFDFDLVVSPQPVVPKLENIPNGDNRSFMDRRTFFGLYVNDEWTPVKWLTVTLGARYDRVSEALTSSVQEIGTPSPDVAEDSRAEGQWSGGVSVLGRIMDRPVGPLDVLNAYVSLKSNFKPAAPNFLEAESARILDPERVRSGEFGIKTRWLEKTLSFDVTFFHMNFENMVVSTLGPTGLPEMVNAGEQRFQGTELDLQWRPCAVKGLLLAAGYAHHDATFVNFSFLTPDGQLRVVDGKRLELVPRDMWNVRAAYGSDRGPGGFVAIRHQNIRPLTRRNTFYTDSFFEWDAGATWNFAWGMLSVTGRNLGDSRHYIADSEIGDSQFYVAPPRRVTAELTFRF
jgi:outer membrane receptor protein involved in Fe transport